MASSLSTSVSLRSTSTFAAQRFSASNGLRSAPFVNVGAPLSSRRLRICCEASAFVAKPETVEKVIKIVAKQLATAPETIKGDAKFSELGADSLDQVEIVMALEEEFNIEIEESGAESIATVQDAADLIEKAAAACAAKAAA